MSNKRSLTSSDYESIILNRSFGLPNVRIAEKLDLSAQSVARVLNSFDAVAAEDWARCCDLCVRQGVSLDMLRWAADVQGKTIPPIIEKSYEDYVRKQQEEKKRATQSTPPSAQAPGSAAPVAATPPAGNDQLFFVKILEALNKHNELMEQLLDVVIPKYVGDMKDNFNANSDVLRTELQKCGDKLETINLKLRKRGM